MSASKKQLHEILILKSSVGCIHRLRVLGHYQNLIDSYRLFMKEIWYSMVVIEMCFVPLTYEK